MIDNEKRLPGCQLSSAPGRQRTILTFGVVTP